MRCDGIDFLHAVYALQMRFIEMFRVALGNQKMIGKNMCQVIFLKNY
jgi:hypothetical protein